MKRFSIILAFTAVLLLAAAFPVEINGPHPFVGNWKGIDQHDGSNLTLWIVEEANSGGKVFEVRGQDDRTGEWCGGPARMEAVGVLEEENVVHTSMVWWCLPPGDAAISFPEDYLSYDPVADTLTGSDGTVYRRTP